VKRKITSTVHGHLAGGLVDSDRATLTWLHELEQRENVAVSRFWNFIIGDFVYTQVDINKYTTDKVFSLITV
jgi:predicted DCC family thiol-disulfide oxidoreductase YuxK